MNKCTRGTDAITTASHYCGNCGVSQNDNQNQKPPFKLPDDLSENKKTISNGFVGVQKTQFDPGDWNTYITGFSSFIDNLGTQSQYSKYYRFVSRDDVKVISKNVDIGKNSAEELFIASQIWGWGTGGRGMSHTQEAIETDDFKKIINDVFSLVKQGNIYDAYLRMTIKHCGAAYLSKFLYFSALGGNISPLPVILDGRVVKSLIQVGAHEGWLAKEFSDFNIHSSGNVVVDKNALKYIVFIKQMDMWAKELGCPADYIEYYLWSTG